MVTLTPHKIGATYELNGSVPLLPLGQYITGVSCVMNSYDTLVQNLTVTILTPSATDYLYTISATALQTGAWPQGDHKLEITYTFTGGKIQKTNTFIQPIIEAES